MEQEKVIYGVFNDYTAADSAVDELVKEFPRESLYIYGSDFNEMRPVTAGLIEHRFDRLILYTIVGFAFGGAIAGVFTAFTPVVAGSFIGPLMAAIAAASVGSYLGFLAGALIHFDTPEYRGHVYEAQLSRGEVAVGVRTDDEHAGTARQYLESAGAIELDTKIAA